MTLREKETGMLKITRWDGNPILAPRDTFWEQRQVRNPAACCADGKVYMVYSARTVYNTIYLGLAVSDDGFHFERASDEPFMLPAEEGFDAGTLEDARMVRIGDTFYITYAARAIGKEDYANGAKAKGATSDGVTWTRNFRRGGLATTKDFKTVKRLGPITRDDRYDCNIVLFPEKVNGRYVMLHRPTEYDVEPTDLVPETPACIWMAFSDDLIHWENDQILARPQFDWETMKIGPSTPPIKTAEGWLTLYHGAGYNEAGERVYRVGLMLLDLNDPTRVLARCPNYIMEPETPYELEGTVPRVVFPNGNVVINNTVYIYYGGADTVCAVATVPLQDMLDHVLQYKG